MLCPSIAPSRFREAFEWTLANFDNDAPFENSSLHALCQWAQTSDDSVDSFGIVTFHVALTRFDDETILDSYLARVAALRSLFNDDNLVEEWARRGWVRRSKRKGKTFAPAKFLIEAAGVCPLLREAQGFELLSFHDAAYARASARGVEFED